MSKQADLKEQILSSAWRDLKAHWETDRLLIIANDLDLVAVGEAVRDDDTDQVQYWIAQDSVTRPTAKQVEAWDLIPDRFFRILIVQPYVLMQDEAH